eukprot:CAMPEP_0119120204 /NCGR_PEP_ID=MMETSP1310-20130426/1349_1 /TAXON_ID=464262 /ORGANISM="Genus nov. species nov., Strain RCC2339" /LENGTH=301 /DNA_ID=CAMNT_0007109671 /DNA_START=113 /DNA_END=1015 /DNA_ORIENTATION=-
MKWTVVFVFAGVWLVGSAAASDCASKPSDLDVRVPFQNNLAVHSDCGFGCGAHVHYVDGWDIQDYCAIDMYAYASETNSGTAEGTPLLAAATGTIHKKSETGCLGNRIVTQHSTGSGTVHISYGHMMHITTTKGIGETIYQGERIGLLGDTGCSNGPHVHFAMYLGASCQDDSGSPYCYGGQSVNPGFGSFSQVSNNPGEIGGGGPVPTPTPVPVPVPTPPPSGCQPRYQAINSGISFRTSTELLGNNNRIGYFNYYDIVWRVDNYDYPGINNNYWWYRVRDSSYVYGYVARADLSGNPWW